MSTIEDLLASLTPQARQKLLAQLDARAAPDKVTRRARNEAPLSYAQRGLWFLSQLRPDDSVYNLCYSIQWPDALDLAALAAALADLTERHEVLRTILPALDGEPRQMILPSLPVPLPEVSLASDDIAGQDEWTRRAATAPFDLARGPLLRAAAIRRGDRCTLVLAVHHVIFDARSTEILLDELVRLYDARVSGRPAGLADLPVQFADFAAWQHDRIADHALDADLAYWRKKLDGLQPLSLAPHRQPGAGARSAGGAQSFHITDQLTVGLAALGRRRDATLFMVLLAGFVALLHGLTGRDDIAVGTSVTTRDRPETEGLIGYFLNTLVLRVELTGNMTFGELVELVKSTVLEAFEHKDMPFELLVEDLAPQRTPGVLPLVPVLFEFSGPSRSPGSYNAASKRLAVRGIAGKGARADLTLGISEIPGGLGGWVEYDLAVFDSGAIDRMCDRLLELLETVAAQPESVLAKLPFLADPILTDPILTDPTQTGTAPYVEPRDDMEAAVASMFAELIGVGRVSAHDDFFKIGGNSQLAVRLHACLLSDFGVDVPIGELFDDPTVEGMAEKLVGRIMRLFG